jgi:hypothetical protein
VHYVEEKLFVRHAVRVLDTRLDTPTGPARQVSIGDWAGGL